MKNAILIGLLALAACDNHSSDTAGPEPSPTLEWASSSYTIPAGQDAVDVTIRFTWDVPTDALGGTIMWSTVHRPDDGGPTPNYFLPGFMLPCRPCTQTITLHRGAATGAFVFQAMMTVDGRERSSDLSASTTVAVE